MATARRRIPAGHETPPKSHSVMPSPPTPWRPVATVRDLVGEEGEKKMEADTRAATSSATTAHVRVRTGTS